MNTTGDEASSDSDHRVKRRKPNPVLNGNTKAPVGGSPAAAPSKFAAKYMAKYGHVEGKGLGASGTGRVAPIDVQVRPQGAGLGAIKEKTKQVKAEEKREAALRGVVLEDSEEEERKRKKRLREKRKSGISGAQSTPSQPKTKYRTVAEVEAAAEGLEVPNVLKSIIDATGSETKLLNGAAGLMKSHSVFQPEKTYAEKIAERAEVELKAFADEWITLGERKTYLDLQASQMATEIVEEEDESQKLEGIISAVQDLQLTPTWEDTTDKLEHIQLRYEGDIDISALQEVAVAAIHPLFKAEMSDWEPLKEPLHLVKDLQRLIPILGVQPPSTNTDLALQNGISYTKQQSKSTTAYETMIYKFWLPPVRRAITDDWDPHDPRSLLNLVDAWRPLLPAFIFTSLVDNLVVQRLSDALKAWSPHRTSRKHRQPPHTYILDWLEKDYLSKFNTSTTSSTGLIYNLRQKLKSILSTYPIEKGPSPGISAWQPILMSTLTTILTNHLLPRLSSHLSTNLVIDPSDQDLSPLTQVLASTSALMKPETTARLLVAELFPKWHYTLYLWLTSSPNYDEIWQWYRWWKEQIPEDVRADLAIEAEFMKGLETINLALDLKPEDVAAELPAPAPVSTTRPGTAPRIPVAEPVQKTEPVELPPEVTFRDVVEDWCNSQDLRFLPLREADPSTGMPLFRITASPSGKGGVVVYLKGDILWAREKGQGKGFSPVGLEEGLVGRAHGK